jgi:multidrug efflux system outer membrane protein
VRTTAIFFLSIVLCACSGPRPRAPSAAAVVPPTAWRGDLEREGNFGGEWWRAFGDPALNNVVQRALDHNTDVAIAAFRVEEARSQYRIAEARRKPNLELAAEGSHDRTVDPFLQGITQTDGAAELAVSYDFDLFGRLSSSSAAARALLLASEAARDTVRLAIASTAARGYVTLLELDAQLTIVRDTLKARAGSLQIIRRRQGAGYSSTLELRQAEAEYYATEQLIPATELSIRRQEDGLTLLLGENPAGIERSVNLQALLLPSVPVGLPASILRQRPDLMQAEQQLVATDRSLDVARAEFLPRIQLTASGGYADSTIFANPINLYSFGASVLAPIFEGGRLRAQADAAAARRDQAAFQYRKSALNAFREVEDALATVRRDEEQERSIANQSESLKRTLTLATNRFLSGYSPYLEQLDAERQLLSAQLALAQSRADRLSAIIDLYHSLGGGWRAPRK